MALSSKLEVNQEVCAGCGTCELNCPEQAITCSDRIRIDSDRCRKCLECLNRCPTRAIIDSDSKSNPGKANTIIGSNGEIPGDKGTN